MSSDTSGKDPAHDGPAAPIDSASPIERRLATILCADVSGYSQMMGANEERTVRVFRGHREIFESLVRQHRGRIFNTAGDALLAEFASAVEAVRCATEIQAALRSRNDRLAPEERMQFRIGINLGDVIVQGGDLLGDGVNVAARIQTATEPGGICISGSVHDQIQNKLSLDFKPLGEQSYKNIANPVRTYTINDGGAAVTRPMRRTSSKVSALVGVAAVLLAGAGYLGYRQFESQRAEQARVQAQLAEQLAAQKQATEQAQRAVEDAKREAQLQAQRQAADETLRRAQEERARVEQDRKALDTEKKAAEAAKKQAEATQRAAPAAPAAPAPSPAPSAAAAPRATTAFDGAYSGRLCNQNTGKAPNCWPVELSVRNGVVESTWPSRTGKTSSASGRVAADGAIELKLQGWTSDSTPIDGTLSGRIAQDAVTASGQWRDRAVVTGTFRRTAAAQASATRHDGSYTGQMCNQWMKPPQCWAVPLQVRNGIVEGSWLSGNTQKTATVRGTIAPDGSLRVTASSWTKSGVPTDAVLVGSLRDGTLAGAGKWSEGSGEIVGSWRRP